jgi:hypothetical protein
LLEVLAELARSPLGGLERDIAGKPLGHHYVHRSLADIVALDEAGIFELRPLAGAQHLARLADCLKAFHLLNPDVEEAHGRPVESEQHRGHGAAHHREFDKMPGVGADRGAQIEHDRFPLERRPESGDCRSIDAGHGSQIDLCHGHQRAGIAGRHGGIGLTPLHGIDRKPHRGFATPLA